MDTVPLPAIAIVDLQASWFKAPGSGSWAVLRAFLVGALTLTPGFMALPAAGLFVGWAAAR